MSKFTLALGIHNHQPVGNFESVFEQAHQDAYAPFLDVLKQYPRVRLSLHQSGILWDWQERHHPEYFTLVKSMLDLGQIDLLTGGFYEPILTSIPARDVKGQIAMLTEYLRKHFGTEATGAWLTERVWEPHLPKILAEAGVTFLPVDDTHFLYAGLEHIQLTGPFITEDEGATVTLLPIQKQLRYLIPFGTVDEAMLELRRQAEYNPQALAVYADDGEKFGVWPNTHKHCYVDSWLADFFAALSEAEAWLDIIPLGEASRRPAAGRVYLPSASYEEMLHWSLPAKAFVEYEGLEQFMKQHASWDRYGRFVRGGHWRGFLTKYEEANLMHKKMLYVSSNLAAYQQGDPRRIQETAEITDRLYASQVNCPYWHGVFGGLYLPHLRQAVYGAMIAAEAKLHQLTDKGRITRAAVDYDADGFDEVLLVTDSLSAAIKPSRGGTLLNLGLLEHNFELIDTLTRRKEGYHLKLDKAVTADDQESGTASIHDLVLTKEPGLQKFLVDDWYLKRCFIDHVFARDVSFESFASGKYGEDGDFILEPYQLEPFMGEGRATVVRDGWVRQPNSEFPLRIRKTFDVSGGNVLKVTYELSSRSDQEQWINFAVENNFNFQAGHAPDRYIVIDNRRSENSFLDSEGAFSNARAIALVDEWRQLAVAVRSQDAADIWHLPIFTVSLSEGGFEKVYQGTTIVHRLHLPVRREPTVLRFTVFAGEQSEVLSKASADEAVATQRT